MINWFVIRLAGAHVMRFVWHLRSEEKRYYLVQTNDWQSNRQSTWVFLVILERRINGKKLQWNFHSFLHKYKTAYAHNSRQHYSMLYYCARESIVLFFDINTSIPFCRDTLLLQIRHKGVVAVKIVRSLVATHHIQIDKVSSFWQ